MFLKNSLRSLLDRYFHSFARKSDLDNLYNQLAGLLEIRAMVGEDIPFGPLRGWALSPDALMWILRDVRSRKSPRVIEFGAGESTIAIAATLRRMNSGSLVTVEHDSRFRDEIGRRLALAGLDSIVDLRSIEMRSYECNPEFPAFVSYDLDAFDASFDVAVVDGPISTFGTGTRLVPLQWCMAHLKNAGTIYLDDAERPQEQRVIASVCKTGSAPRIECLSAEKGLTRFSLPPSGYQASAALPG